MFSTLTLVGRALVDPVAGVAASVQARRWLVPLLAVSISVSLSGAVYALKLDAARQVIPGLSKKGDLSKVSEREISDAVQQAERTALVAGVAKGAMAVPVGLLLLALALKLVAWLWSKPMPFSAAFTVATVAMLPIAVYHLIWAAALWQQDFVSVRSAAELVPSSLGYLAPEPGPVQRALAAVDFFKLWSVLLLGLGLARATELKAWRGVVWGGALYLLFASAFLVGLPGLAENFANQPGQGPK